MTTQLSPPPARALPATASWDADLAAFVDQVESGFSRARLNSFWELDDAFDRLASSGLASRFLQRELQRLSDNPSYLGNWRPNQIVIHRGAGYSLGLWYAGAPRRYIHSSAFHGFYSPVGNETVRFRAYRLPPGYRNQIFDPTVQLVPQGSGLVAPGGVLRVDGSRDVYDFSAERLTPVLRFISVPFHTMEWLFDKDSLRAVQANDADRSATQLRVAAFVLGKLADRRSLPALGTLSGHPHHAVRWSAVQAIGRISRQAVIGSLRDLVRDDHPQIQAAATAALRKIEAET